MRILVTGGAGFIGSHLVDKLIEEGHRVAVIDNFSTGRRENIHEKARFYELDIRDPNAVSVFEKEKPEAVFHLAAQIDVRKSQDDPDEDTSINALGAVNILKNSLRAGVKKFIFASSGGAIYGETRVLPTPETHPARPLSVYGKNKLFFERMLEFHRRASDLDYVALRFANVYGPRQNSGSEAGVVAIFIDTLLSGNAPTIYGDGKQTRDFLYVDDAVKSFLTALEAKLPSRIVPVFNVGHGKEISVSEVLSTIGQQLSRGQKPRYGSARKGEILRSAIANDKFKRFFGIEPRYDLENGIAKTIQWFRDKGKYR